MSAITIESLTKSFSTQLTKKKQILHAVSLRADHGKVTGFIGLNGAGKSTLINLVMGFTFPESGTISIFGQDPTLPVTRKKTGYMPEHTRFQEHLTGFQLLRYVGAVAGLSSQTTRKRGSELLERLALADAGNNQIRSYSKGMRCCICMFKRFF